MKYLIKNLGGEFIPILLTILFSTTLLLFLIGTVPSLTFAQPSGSGKAAKEDQSLQVAAIQNSINESIQVERKNIDEQIKAEKLIDGSCFDTGIRKRGERLRKERMPSTMLKISTGGNLKSIMTGLIPILKPEELCESLGLIIFVLAAKQMLSTSMFTTRMGIGEIMKLKILSIGVLLAIIEYMGEHPKYHHC